MQNNQFNEDLVQNLKNDQEMDMKQLDRYEELMKEISKRVHQRLRVINYLDRLELDT